MWGLRVIIPYKYRERIINDLHDQHPGIIRMKALSRIHVWYPYIDKDIETCVANVTKIREIQLRLLFIHGAGLQNHSIVCM